MLQESIRTPIRTGDFLGIGLVGGILLVLSPAFVLGFVALLTVTPLAILAAPIAVLPGLVIRGYYVRVVGAASNGGETVPSFVRWGGLYRDGVKSVLLSAGYLLPAIVTTGVLVSYVGTLNQDLTSAELAAGGGLGTIPAGIGFLAVGLYLVVFAFVRPSAIACLAQTGRLHDGFALRRVLTRAATGRYVAGWLLSVAVTVAGLAVTTPLVALLLGIPLVFYARVISHWLFGRGLAISPGASDVDESMPPDSERGTSGPLASSNTSPGAATLAPAGEISTAVQTGRGIPLTATDIISSAPDAELLQASSDTDASQEETATPGSDDTTDSTKNAADSDNSPASSPVGNSGLDTVTTDNSTDTASTSPDPGPADAESHDDPESPNAEPTDEVANSEDEATSAADTPEPDPASAAESDSEPFEWLSDSETSAGEPASNSADSEQSDEDSGEQ
ncbi:MAG: protein of unknown function (DUF4013) [uncultured archaeon A07HR60]|nr:MAG: protein of unknown function (DUF4013) [uncultured archaeon A07HR60]